jgi:hypothetical protein
MKNVYSSIMCIGLFLMNFPHVVYGQECKDFRYLSALLSVETDGEIFAKILTTLTGKGTDKLISKTGLKNTKNPTHGKQNEKAAKAAGGLINDAGEYIINEKLDDNDKRIP